MHEIIFNKVFDTAIQYIHNAITPAMVSKLENRWNSRKVKLHEGLSKGPVNTFYLW